MSGEESKVISNERDLARLLTTRWNIGIGKCFLNVKLISRSIKVSPDIDLLRVYTNQWHPEENTSTGFELKVLRYNGRQRRVNLEPFYQGLGQVLTYFEHGIDRAALVVGFHKDCEQHLREAKDAQELLVKHCNFMKSSILRSFQYLEILSIRNGDLARLVHDSNWDRARFSHLSDDAKLARDSIFKLQFSSEKI